MDPGKQGKLYRKSSDAISLPSTLSLQSSESKSKESLDNQKKKKTAKSLDGIMLCSTTSSSQIRSEIASILISNHLEFLECILDSPFGKEGGGAMTKSILDLLLEYHSLEQVELFLWRVVKKKIEKTKRVSSESSMKTLLRDNSWEILLFSSFLHHESKSYLLNVLQNPVLGALALFEKMESTLSKPSLYGQKLPAQLLVEKILHSILAKKDIIPLSTIRLCASLKKELDAVFHICPHSPTSPISSLLMSPITPILSTLEPHPSSSDVSLSFEISELLPASVDEFVNSATTLEPAPIPSKKTKKKKPHPPILQKFSASEQMISTFLFLRLFVPVLTLPEKYGLLKPGEATKSVMKYLLLTGKELITLCNDTEKVLGAEDFQRCNKKKIRRILLLFTADKSSTYNQLGAALNLELEKESLLLDKSINQYMLKLSNEDTSESSLAPSKYRQTVHGGFDAKSKFVHKSLPFMRPLQIHSSNDYVHISEGFKKEERGGSNELEKHLEDSNATSPDDYFISTLLTYFPKILESFEMSNQLTILQCKEYRCLFARLKELLEAFQASSLSNEPEESEKNSIIKKVGKWIRFTSFSSTLKDQGKARKSISSFSKNGVAQI